MFSPKIPTMAMTLRILARLLSYPDADLRQHLRVMRDVLHDERALTSTRLAELDALIASIDRQTDIDAEADYVQLFDSGRRTSLHLFEHVHGDSRERGPAMIDLGQTYEKAGLILAEGELPDYLPAVLEFVSTQPPDAAKAFLGEMAHILNALFGALQRRNSPYASVLGALLDLAGEQARPIVPVAEESLDESWAEPVVFDGCSVRGQGQPGQTQAIHVVQPLQPPRPSRATSAQANPQSGVVA